MADKDFGGNEVSCRAIGILFSELEKKGLSPETLAKGTDYSVAHLCNVKERVSWSGYCRVMKNATKIWNDEEFMDMGERLFDRPEMKYITVVIRLLYSPKEAYKWIVQPKIGAGNQQFTNIKASFREIGLNSIEIELTLHSGYEQPPNCFFLITKGTFIAFPRFFGLDGAVVEMEEIDGGRRYTIEVPSKKPPLGFIRKAVKWPVKRKETPRGKGSFLQSSHTFIQEASGERIFRYL